MWSIHSRLPVTKYSNLSPSQKCICSLLPEPLFWMPAWYPFPFFFFSILTTLFNSRSKFAKSLEANGWMELKLWKQGFSIVAWLAFSVKRKMKRQMFKHFLIFVVKHIHFCGKPQKGSLLGGELISKPWFIHVLLFFTQNIPKHNIDFELR